MYFISTDTTIDVTCWKWSDAISVKRRGAGNSLERGESLRRYCRASKTPNEVEKRRAGPEHVEDSSTPNKAYRELCKRLKPLDGCGPKKLDLLKAKFPSEETLAAGPSGCRPF